MVAVTGGRANLMLASLESPHMRVQIPILPDNDLRRLEEISNQGTLDGHKDTELILRYLASALHQVAEGQKALAEAMRDHVA